MSEGDIEDVLQIAEAIFDAGTQIFNSFPSAPTPAFSDIPQFVGPLPFPAFSPSEIFPDIQQDPEPIFINQSQSVMEKRVRADALTGGTGDINPQYVYFSADIPAALAPDNMMSATFTFPIQQFNGGQNFVPIVELLKTSVNFDKETTLREAVGASAAGFLANWFTYRLSMGGADNPGSGTLRNAKSQRTFYEFSINRGAGAGPAAYVDFTTLQGAGETNGAIGPHDLNHTDEDGHGLLLYGNTVTASFQFHTVTGGITVRSTAMIYYRVKNVSLQQYLAGQAALGGTLAVN